MVKRILHLMFFFAPAAFIADRMGADPGLVFLLAALGLIPLADLIGEATEHLAEHTGPRIGGLLNATLGNAAELIITIFAINAGLLELVKASITGSILGNLLLILGLSIFMGGLKNGIQTFDRRTVSLNATLVLLAIIALAIPSLFDSAFVEAIGRDTNGDTAALVMADRNEGEEPSVTEEAETDAETEVVVPEASEAAVPLDSEGASSTAELRFSESVAVVMIVLYALSIWYSLRSGGGPHNHGSPVEGAWSVRRSVILLLAATAGTAFMSEVLVGAVEHVTESLGLTEFFLGIIIIPLVGNVAEHLVAVETAYKNKMELSLAVSFGSSLQIALFVAPVLVFIALLFGERLLLVFTTFELIALFGAGLVAAFIALDGESNWLEGAMLLAIYLIVGLAFFFLPAVA
ncbi:MAG: cation transporter [Burkholderiales bacterium]|nr:cation transporter [Anaerolineae bacterium]